MTARRVVLAMSGGVDSSAAAVLLHRQGYEVIGLFMRSGETEDACTVASTDLLPVIDTPANRQGCCSSEDAADARRVADELGISFHSLNFREAFTRIKDYFADEYMSGRTPNPCVQCNNWLKFGRLWDFARQIGADHIATGHYARITTDSHGQHQLHTGIDPKKDQSYVLFGLRRELLSKVILPVGNFHKSQIRDFASEAGLKVANKKDSYEICFVSDNDYAGFLSRYRGQQDTVGEFVDTDGNVLGQHAGYERFTVGQRRGLGIAFGEPRFVVSVKPESRQVVLGRREDLAVSSVIATQLNWLTDRPADKFRCRVALRYQQRALPCSVSVDENDRAVIQLDEETFGVAPGQASVFYDDDRVLGGGWIQSTVS
ncbi:MAG: tRNA 2-thiouridine(34) synthase MnmA [Fuerstiella sp.]|nr:tRNA 2-thiouridine(34) synthase MnmA [Fuerstiella sp.]